MCFWKAFSKGLDELVIKKMFYNVFFGLSDDKRFSVRECRRYLSDMGDIEHLHMLSDSLVRSMPQGRAENGKTMAWCLTKIR